jgi:hypothetical protein
MTCIVFCLVCDENCWRRDIGITLVAALITVKFLWLSKFLYYIQPRLIMVCTCPPGISADCDLIFMEYFSLTIQGPSWPWSYGSWIYNYLCNRCLSPLMLWVRIYVSCLSSSVKVTNVISKEIISSIFGPTRNNYHVEYWIGTQ